MLWPYDTLYWHAVQCSLLEIHITENGKKFVCSLHYYLEIHHRLETRLVLLAKAKLELHSSTSKIGRPVLAQVGRWKGGKAS